ncbi:MAG TPA: site-specific integrase [Gaiellaceae bacterium]|nr:site-specific integrase [Gaiellaceae bacterium]
MARAKRHRTKHEGVHYRDLRGGRVYDINYRSGGTRHWESGFPTMEAALARRDELRYLTRQGIRAPVKRRRYRDFVADDYLPRLEARVAQGELRASTAAQYKRDIRNHLLPEFGAYRVDDIDVERIERFRDKLTADGLSNDTVRRIVTTLGYTLKLARKWRLIAHNPVADADKPTTRRRKPSLPSLEDVERLAKAMPNREMAALVLFAAFSGARKSECFALRWTEVDLARNHETVRIVRQYYKGELVEDTKTLAGAREILLAPRAARALRELSVAQQVDARPNPHGLVFPSPRGSYWRDSNFDRRIWQKARTKAKLSEITFHTLRYFYISMVRAQGLPTALTEQLVGHVDERTHRGYTRPIPGTEPLIRAALAEAFSPGKKRKA